MCLLCLLFVFTIRVYYSCLLFLLTAGRPSQSRSASAANCPSSAHSRSLCPASAHSRSLWSVSLLSMACTSSSAVVALLLDRALLLVGSRLNIELVHVVLASAGALFSGTVVDKLAA
eukprot:4228907-Pyramimonas_sp.AAC.2